MAGPLKLVHSHTYTGYQLYSRVRYENETADVCFRFVATTVLAWLRARMDDRNVPDALVVPSPEEAAHKEDMVLSSYHYNNGFTIDITSLVDSGIWSLRLAEPDAGQDGRMPVPGRSIITNIALRIEDEEWVELGIRTTLMDPLDAAELASTYRPAIIRTLLRSPQIHMEHVSPLAYREIREIKSHKDIDQLFAMMANPSQCLPAVVFTYARESRSVGAILERIDHELDLTGSRASFVSQLTRMVDVPEDLDLGFATLAYDVSEFAHQTYGYGWTYLIDNEILDQIYARFARPLHPGDIVFIQPKRFGGDSEIIRYADLPERYQRDHAFDDLMKRVLCYSKGKDVDYHGVVFEREARKLEQKVMIENATADSDDDLEAMFEELFDSNTVLKSNVHDLQTRCDFLEAENKRLRATDTGLPIDASAIYELFPNEVYDLIISVLQDASVNYAVPGSRAKDLIDLLLEDNPLKGDGIKIFTQAKKILSRNPGISRSDISDLIALGFTVSSKENNHLSVCLSGDKQHSVILASTPSDVREGKNAVRNLHRFLSVYKNLPEDNT